MLFTKLEKLLFLLLPVLLVPLASSENLFWFCTRSSSKRCGAVSMRGFKAVWLEDCLNVWTPRSSGLVWEECGAGGRRIEFCCDGDIVSSNALSMPRASNGAPINSSELRSLSERRPGSPGRDLEEV